MLQVKEARPSALLPHLAAVGFDAPEAAHEGRRVVMGQKRMQVVSDMLLGWTEVDGRPFQVRSSATARAASTPRPWPPTRWTTTAA